VEKFLLHSRLILKAFAENALWQNCQQKEPNTENHQTKEKEMQASCIPFGLICGQGATTQETKNIRIMVAEEFRFVKIGIIF
jgi:hypothetical protein